MLTRSPPGHGACWRQGGDQEGAASLPPRGSVPPRTRGEGTGCPWGPSSGPIGQGAPGQAVAQRAWGSRTALVCPKAGVPAPRGGSSTAVCPSRVRHPQPSPRQPGTSPAQHRGRFFPGTKRRAPASPVPSTQGLRGSSPGSAARAVSIYFCSFSFQDEIKLQRGEGKKKNPHTKKQTHNLFFLKQCMNASLQGKTLLHGGFPAL